MDKMQIDIWSDIACPYCYLGLKKLKIALSKFPHRDNIELVWHSYELNPDLPTKAPGKPYIEFLAQNSGMSQAVIEKDVNEIKKAGAEVGIDYNFEKIVIANTFLALRLVKLANEKQLASKAEDILFEAYFSQGKDVSDKKTLVDLGKLIGIQEVSIERMLENDLYSQEVRNDVEYADQTLDLEFIPYYLFNNEHIVQGSITSENYAQVLEKSYGEWLQRGKASQRGEIISGQSCSIDGVCS